MKSNSIGRALLFLYTAHLVFGVIDPALLAESSDYDNCRNIDDSENLVLFWTKNTNNIDFALSGKTSGWIGFGLNRDNEASMIPSDAVIGYVQGTLNAVVNDYDLSDRFMCAADQGVCTDVSRGGANSVSNVSGKQNGTVTTIRFTRPLAAQDASLDVAIQNANQAVIWAMGSTDTIQQHDSGYGTTSLNFFTPAPIACPIASENGLECAGRGTCNKGCCVCESGWGAKDCSRNLGTQSSLPSEIIPSTYTFVREVNDKFKVYWKILESEDSVQVAVECKCTGWIAFGPSENGLMLDSDIALGTVANDGSIVLNDYRITDRSGSCPGVCLDTNSEIGGNNDLIDFNGNQQNGVTQLIWIRKLNTGDSKGDIAITNADMKVIWGYHPTSKTIVEHESDTRGSFTINFFTGDIEAGSDLRLIHGILMFIAWGVIIPFTSILARYFKKFRWWFDVHRWSNGVAIAAVIAAFIIAIFMSSVHFNSVHSILGLIVVILGVIQPVLGIIADKLYDEQREGTPIFPDKVHWIVGWVSLTAALVNIFFGLTLYNDQGLMIGYGIFFAIIAAFMLGFSVYKTVIGAGSEPKGFY